MHSIYSLQNAFTYTNSLIPPSFLSIHLSKNILYIPGTMLDTKDTKKWTRHTSLYIYRVHSLMEDFKVNGYKMCKEVQWGYLGYYANDIEGPKSAMKSERVKEVMPELHQVWTRTDLMKELGEWAETEQSLSRSTSHQY